ncbi:MAG: thioredoxin family protein [Ferruginibacter sp.]
MKYFAPFLIIVLSIAVYSFVPKMYSNDSAVNLKKEKGIQFWGNDWKSALSEAKSKKKLIFLDAYASWCGPCKMLKKNTFTDEKAGNFFNDKFISVALDMEKGEGPEIGAKYGVNAFPTLIITDADGNLITYTQGYITPAQLIEFGQYGLNKTK